MNTEMVLIWLCLNKDAKHKQGSHKRTTNLNDRREK